MIAHHRSTSRSMAAHVSRHMFISILSFALGAALMFALSACRGGEYESGGGEPEGMAGFRPAIPGAPGAPGVPGSPGYTPAGDGRVVIALREGFKAREVISGRWRLAALCFLPDGRMAMGEKETGNVYLAAMDDNGNWSTSGKPFVTLPDCAYDKSYCERGLVGLEGWRDPVSGTTYLYVYYTREKDATGVHRNRIVRYPVGPKDTGGAGELEEIIPSSILPAGWNHNGGCLRIGPDGALYFTNGENGRDGQPENAQNHSSLTGVVARVSPRGEPLDDNPFVIERAGRQQRSVWAYGMRNTFRVAFDPVTHQMWGTENGPAEWDELNLIRAGDNGGWPFVLGLRDAKHNNGTRAKLAAGPGRYTDPRWVWKNCPSLTGIAFEPGKGQFPDDLRHGMFVAAYLGGHIWHMKLDSTRTNVEAMEVFSRIPSPESLSGAGIADIAFGPDGKLYFSTVTYQGDSGKADRVVCLEWVGEGKSE